MRWLLLLSLFAFVCLSMSRVVCCVAVVVVGVCCLSLCVVVVVCL